MAGRGLAIAGVTVVLLLTQAQAELIGPGDVAFTGFNADGNDGFAFVTFVDIAQNAELYLTDRDWTGSFDSGEGTALWKASDGPLAAGTTVAFSNTSSTTAWTASSGTLSGTNINLNATDEALWAYLDPDGDDDPDAFLAMISNDWAGASQVLTGTGLTLGSTAANIPGNDDVLAYDGPRSGQTSFADYLTMINRDGNTSNWLLDDGTGDQSSDGNAPDVPFDDTPFTLVPEPGAMVLALLAFTGLALRRRRQ